MAAYGENSMAAVIVGALLYLVLSLACTAVYAPLGVTPAEVGLDYGNLLAQSAVGVAALTVIAMLTGLAVVAFRIAVARPSVSRHQPWPTLVAGSVAVAFFLDLCRYPFSTAHRSALPGPRSSSPRLQQPRTYSSSRRSPGTRLNDKARRSLPR
jgi:hypothetical protein